MSWTSKSIAAAATAAALFATGAAAAETIVVKSSGPSAKAYPPGKPIPDNSKVSLKAGDSVVILDGRGTRVFRGPGVFSTTASTATSTSIGSVLKNTGTRQVRTGAVRGAGSMTARSAKPTNVWFVDATKSGTVCYAGTEGLQLWMPAATAAGTLTVTRASDGKSVPLAVRAGQEAKLWPMEELPVADGSEFSLAGAAMPSPVRIRFASLGSDPQGLEATAAGMIRAGCNAQLDRLIEMVAVPAYDETPAG